jgi:hypothetical protein
VSRRAWSRIRPNSQEEAIRLCLDHAKAVHRRSVAQVGDLVGVSEWVIYKWVSEGGMPSRRIRPFEHACGIDYLTQYLAASSHKLLVAIPSGKKAKDEDVLALQTGFNAAVNLLAQFYKGDAEADETLGALTSVMEEIAGHRANVGKALAPELALFGSEE